MLLININISPFLEVYNYITLRKARSLPNKVFF
jgi:hypothetical protein